MNGSGGLWLFVLAFFGLILVQIAMGILYGFLPG
jgi:hypothetical protein